MEKRERTKGKDLNLLLIHMEYRNTGKNKADQLF